MAQDAQDDSIPSSETDTAYVEQESAKDSVSFRSVPDTTIARLKNSKEFRYANDPAYWKRKKVEEEEEPESKSFDPFGVIRYILLAVFVVVLAYAIYQVLVQNKLIVFKKNKRFNSSESSEEEWQKADLEGMAEAAEKNGNYRLAVRFRYKKLLEDLHERQLIRMHTEYTNWDYARQLANHPLNKRFRYLTLAYDYVWYGEFQPTAEQYEMIKENFKNFLH